MGLNPIFLRWADNSFKLFPTKKERQGFPVALFKAKCLCSTLQEC